MKKRENDHWLTFENWPLGHTKLISCSTPPERKKASSRIFFSFLKPASVTELPASVPIFTKQFLKSFEHFYAANYAVIFKRKNDCY